LNTLDFKKKNKAKKEDIKKKIKILFIDLSEKNALQALKEIKHSVKSFSFKRIETKKDFLSTLDIFNPDIIISDISIPGIKCRQILNILSDKNLTIPLIVFTEGKNEDAALKCVQAGAWDYVIKERPKRIGMTLLRALKKKQLGSALIKECRTLKENNEILKRYKRWEANIPGILFLIRMQPDLSYEFTHISSASKELLDVDPILIMKDPALFNTLIHPGDAVDLLKAFEVALNSGTLLRFEARFIIKGEIKWFFFISRSEIQSNSTIMWDGILMDITEKKLAEEAAIKERNLMNILMNNLPDAVYFKDLESRFIRVNRGSLPQIGKISENEMLMKTDFDFLSFETATETRKDELEIIKTGKPILNKIEKDTLKSGEVIWTSTTKVPLKTNEGEIIGTFGVSRDISEQKKIEESLQNERNLLRTLIDAIPDRVFVKNTEGKFILNNKAHLNHLGYNEQKKAIGKSDYDYFKPEIAAKYNTYDKLVMENGKSFINHEEQSYFNSGDKGWHLSTKIPLKDAQNRIIGLVGISRDVTRTKKIQQQLKASESRLHNIINAISAVLYTIKIEMDLPGIKGINLTLYWISRNIMQFGYEPEDIVKSKWRKKLVHPDDLNLLLSQMSTLYEKNKLVVEYRIKHNAGNYIWLRDEMVLIRNEMGKPTEIYGSWLDITEQKQAEELVAEERNLMQLLMENLPDTIYFKDLDSRFIKVNKGYLKRFNIESENDLLMKTDFDLFDYGHADEARNDELEIIRTDKALINKVEKELLKSGKMAWISSTKVPLKNLDGNIIGTFGVSRDITDLILAEKKLADERNLMSTLINCIPDAIFVKDIKGKYLLSNIAYLHLLGVKTQEELIGKTPFDYYPSDIAQKFIDDDQVVIQSGTAIINKEEETIWRDKHIGWHLITKVPLRDPQDNITGVVCMSRDITHSKSIQEQLQSSEARLRHITNTVSAVLYTVKYADSVFIPVWVGENIVQFGYEVKEVLTTNWWFNVIHPDDLEYVKSSIQTVLLKDRLVLEYRLKCKDGHYIWIIDETILIRDKDGNPFELFGSWLDITERMKSDEALMTSEAQLSVALKIAHLAHWEYDAQEKQFIFNDQYYSLLRTSVGQVGSYKVSFKRFINHFVFGEDTTIILEEFNKALSASDPYYSSETEFRMKYSDGTTGDFAVSFFIMKDVHSITTKCFGVTQDITERKLVEYALRASEAQLASALKLAHLAHWEYDFTNDLLTFNDQFYSLLRSNIQQEGSYTMSSSYYAETFVHHEDSLSIAHEIQKAVNAQDPDYNSQSEYRVRYADGDTGWFAISLFISKDAAGKTTKAFGVAQDITERKQAEESLIASEIKLSYALKMANLAHWEYDAANELFTFNDQFYSLFRTTAKIEGGYTMSPKQYSKRFVYPEDKQIVGYEVQRSLESSEPDYNSQLEHRINYSDGEIGYLSVRIFTLKDEDGVLVKLFGVSQDITARKRAEEALRKSEAQLSHAVKLTHLAYWEIDLVNYLFIFNDQFYSLLHTTAQAEGSYIIPAAQYVKRFVHPDDAYILNTQIKRALETNDAEYSNMIENRIIYADGGIGYFSARFNITKDFHGKTIRGFGATQDITERKHAEEALIASETKLSYALKIANLAHWEYDVKSDLFTFNDQFYSLFRTTAEKEGGYNLSSMHYSQRFVYHEDMHLVGIEVQNAINSTDPSYNSQIDHRIVYADGEIGYISVRIFTFRDAEGKVYKTFGVSQDITERKKAEEALIASETKLSYALKIAHLAHWEYDLINDIFTFNDQFYSLFRTNVEKEGGYNMSAMQYSKRFVYPEDAHIVGEETIKSKNSSSPNFNVQVEHRIIYADGEMGYISVRIFNFRNEEGTIIKSVGVTQDITEQKNAEEALRKSEAQLSTAVKIAHLAHWEFNVTSHIFSLNDQFFALMHTTVQAEGGYLMSAERHLERFVFKDDEPLITAELKKAVETDDPNYSSELEFRMFYTDGGMGYFLARYYITKDFQGKTIKVFGATQDITERKQAEEALRASEYFLRKSQSVARIGSFKYHIKSGTWESSKTLDEILGIDSDYPKTLKGCIKLVHPSHRSDMIQLVKRKILTNKRLEKEYRIVSQNNNKELWVLGLGDLEFDNEGKPVTLIGTVQDINERILHEQEKQELDKELHLRNNELEKMLADLKLMQGSLVQSEKMASLGQLSAGIAHEINNPLAYVSSNINRLKEYFQDTVGLLNKWQELQPVLKDNTDYSLMLQQINEFADQIDLNFILEDFDRMMLSINDGTTRIKKIIEGMRGFAHMADNTFSEAQINQAIDDTLTIVWNEIKYKASIEKNYEELPSVICNIGEIKQVLVNLLINAAHSIMEKGKICITTLKDDDYIYILVQDTGSGIPKENLKRIFDPFFTTKPVGKGTGLGLWISSSIIEKHNGTLTVESQDGVGSTFKIKLPIRLNSAQKAGKEITI
jgi:PAS domain S-box-containing protein